jgi:hypothetical protein
MDVIDEPPAVKLKLHAGLLPRCANSVNAAHGRAAGTKGCSTPATAAVHQDGPSLRRPPREARLRPRTLAFKRATALEEPP